MRNLLLCFIFLFSAQLYSQNVITVDFETAGEGYTPNNTGGSSWVDVFNRINYDISGISNEDGYYWAVEDLGGDLPWNPYINLDQINVTGATSFTFSIDMTTHHYNDWDDNDELLITYSIDGAAYSNLMWVQNTEDGDAYNTPAALDTDFDGDGNCGDSTTLPAVSTGNGSSGCNVTTSNFKTFTTSAISLNNNSTLDIKLQFNGLGSNDEGIYLDNIKIEHNGFAGLTSTDNYTVQSHEVITTSSDATTNQLTINSGGSLIVSKGDHIEITGALTNNGTLTINSDSNEFGTLIITGNVSGSGNTIYNRWVNGISTASPGDGDPGWDLLGSPLTNGTLTASDLATDGTNYAIQPYDNSDNSWIATTSAGTFTTTTGVGYSMAKATAGTVSFTGTPSKKTTVDVALTENMSGGGSGDRWNLIANPYPSYVALNGAAKTASNATVALLWYNAVSNNNLGYSDSETGIWYWDGTQYQTANNGSSALWAAPGQAFFVSSPEGGDTFSFRTGSVTSQSSIVNGGSNGDDFIAGDIIEENRGELFINLDQNNIGRKTQIYFLDDVYDGLDSGYDTRTFPMADNNTSIYTRLVQDDEGIDLAIQSLAYSEMWNKVIPIGINVIGGEEIRINLSHNTTPADLNIYLEDAFEGTMTDLKAGDYVLTPSTDLSGIGRFFIHMTADTMSNEEVSSSMLNVFKEVNSNNITIEGLATQSNSINISLYNILGRKVLNTSLSNNMNIQTISTVGMASGIYVIELESGNNRLTKKLIIQ